MARQAVPPYTFLSEKTPTLLPIPLTAVDEVAELILNTSYCYSKGTILKYLPRLYATPYYSISELVLLVDLLSVCL